VLATVPVLADPALPTRHRGDGGLALAGEGVTDTTTAVEAILPTVIRTLIHEFFEKHTVTKVDYLWGRRWATYRLERDVPTGPICVRAIRAPVFLTPPGAGGGLERLGGRQRPWLRLVLIYALLVPLVVGR